MGKGLYRNIVFTNLKHHFIAPFAAAVGIFALTPLLFNITALEGSDVARPIEFMLCWVGGILLTPVFLPEQNKDIRDVVCSKEIDYLKVCGIRVIYSAAAAAALEAAFVGMMKLCESQVTGDSLLGGIASALFLGAIGFAAAGLSRNAVIGYMAAMLYYLANYGMKDKMGVFYLFSMSTGGADTKWWLLLGAAVLTGGTFVVLKVGQKR